MSPGVLGLTGFLGLLFISLVLYALTRIKRCPSDKILVKYGKGTSGEGRSSQCVHGGTAFIWPVIQNYGWLDLTPLTIDIELNDALSVENIRVNTPSTFTVGISTETGIMENAADRLLGLPLQDIRDLARDIIFGQMRVVIATMEIVTINQDRDEFIQRISESLEPELKKVGLKLINVNIKDVNDMSGYIEALGKEAAARAINDAKKQVAEQERDGEIGKAEAEREQRVRVAEANATAVEGENESKVQIADSNSERRQAEAEAERKAIAKEKVSQAKALEESYSAEQEAEEVRAKREKASEYANVVVPAEIEKERIETLAEAEAEETRRIKQGQADGIRSVKEAEAAGHKAILSQKAIGFDDMVRACNGDPQLASLLLITEQLPDLVEEQVKAISNLEIDSVTVWENGKGGNGKTSTADFLSGLVGSLPPLHELTKNVGIDLPEYLGTPAGNGQSAEDLEKLGDALKETASRKKQAEAAVRDWLAENKKQIQSFDLNDDNVVDADELDSAIQTVLQWVERSESPTSEWFISQSGETKGPKPWSEVEEIVKEDPATFINAKGSEHWLPYRVMQIAADNLNEPTRN